MTPPRFQFTIGNLLGATFWAAVSAAAWIVKVGSDETPLWWLLLVVAVRLVGPFAAVGTVFGVRVAFYVLIPHFPFDFPHFGMRFALHP